MLDDLSKLDDRSLKVVLHAMSLDELQHADKRLRIYQGMGDKVRREIKRRKRKARQKFVDSVTLGL